MLFLGGMGVVVQIKKGKIRKYFIAQPFPVSFNSFNRNHANAETCTFPWGVEQYSSGGGANKKKDKKIFHRPAFSHRRSFWEIFFSLFPLLLPRSLIFVPLSNGRFPSKVIFQSVPRDAQSKPGWGTQMAIFSFKRGTSWAIMRNIGMSYAFGKLLSSAFQWIQLLRGTQMCVCVIAMGVPGAFV